VPALPILVALSLLVEIQAMPAPFRTLQLITGEFLTGGANGQFRRAKVYFLVGA
jgi:hypothetical protein